ncbi:hypothetical protein [Rubritalea tangerina]|uniref:hypothetical protein n=1 Tax=Rubritalea tangerina TaxID=430798 RepID=UPI0036180EE5
MELEVLPRLWGVKTNPLLLQLEKQLSLKWNTSIVSFFWQNVKHTAPLTGECTVIYCLRIEGWKW